MANDFYDGLTSETKAKYEKMAPYIELAEQQGDAVFLDTKPWQLTIVIRKPNTKEKHDD